MSPFILFSLFLSLSVAIPQDELACQSIIYCNNDILEVWRFYFSYFTHCEQVVQLSGIFNDSKTFVDMPMRKSAEDVLEAFNTLPTG
jgi:hypothetical protein